MLNREYLKDYLTLCKPKVILLMLITSWVGMLLATNTYIPLDIFILGTIGIAFSGSSAAVINHLVDKKIDSKMNRTMLRPVACGRVSQKQAVVFSIVLGILGLSILAIWVNITATILTFLTLIAYAFFYTMFLKRQTPQNIVIGGIAGATPPLLGWSCITGDINPYSLLLVLIIFTWTPPHFWALAIYRMEEYKKAKIPMLPVTHGIKFTKLCIFLYTILLLIVSILPFLVGMSGIIYLASALFSGFYFIYYAIKLLFINDNKFALKTFNYSIIYLLIIFSGLLIDHYFYIANEF